MGTAANPLMPLSGPDGEALRGHAAFVAAHLDEIAMHPAPIHPDWIVSGKPVARAGPHSASIDGTTSTAVWDCTAGRFHWSYGWEETVIILEGQVRVTSQDGSVRLLKAGDIAFFAAGTPAFWEIETHVRKLAFCRRELPPSIRLSLTLRDRSRDLVKAGLRPLIRIVRKVPPVRAFLRPKPAFGILLVIAAALAWLIPEMVEARSLVPQETVAARLQASATATATRPFSATTLAIGR